MISLQILYGKARDIVDPNSNIIAIKIGFITIIYENEPIDLLPALNSIWKAFRPPKLASASQ